MTFARQCHTNSSNVTSAMWAAAMASTASAGSAPVDGDRRPGLSVDGRYAAVAKLERRSLTDELEQQAMQLRRNGYDIKVVMLDLSFARPTSSLRWGEMVSFLYARTWVQNSANTATQFGSGSSRHEAAISSPSQVVFSMSGLAPF